MSSFPTCQVCNQQLSLKGPAPFLLPCLHTVCETCVTSADGGVLTCSPCERDVNLAETPLQKDEVREKQILHLTVQHQPELVLCTHEEDGNQAVCWCKDCEDFLCEHCQMVHGGLKLTRRHSVQDIGELSPGSLEEELYCKTHPKYILDTWDESCCILTCGKCRLDEHAEHKIIQVEHAAKLARIEIDNLQKVAQSSVDKHAAQIAATANDLQTLDEKYVMIPEKISHTVDSLKTVIGQREKELQIELHQHKEKMRDCLGKKKQTSETCHKRCQVTSEYIHKALQYSSDHDMVSLRHLLQNKTQDCMSSLQTDIEKDRFMPCFNTDGQETIISALTAFGTITSKNEPVVGKHPGDTMSETDILMSRKCEKLEQEMEKLKRENQTLRENLSEKSKEQGGNETTWTGELVTRCDDLTEKLDQLKIVNHTLRENLTREKMEERHGLYRLIANVLDAAFLLHCTHVEFSESNYNAECVHINIEGELINENDPNPPHGHEGLEQYSGTSSTAPLPRHGSPQYFEVKSRVGIEETLTGTDLLLEIGLAREEEQDMNECLDGESQTYSLIVQHCPTHNSICRRVWRQSTLLTCLPDTLDNYPGYSEDLHYGVVYDNSISRIAFLDIKSKKITSRVRNINSSVELWPMFGVYNPDAASVSMSLVVGSDIDMTEWKRALILKSLY